MNLPSVSEESNPVVQQIVDYLTDPPSLSSVLSSPATQRSCVSSPLPLPRCGSRLPCRKQSFRAVRAASLHTCSANSG
eukprot:8759700-Pyramimonas_sp.AAC.1